ncbi:MAG: hypothetical protein L0Y72_09975 [Gemmataceae bacterium]|nr:hypothetical protein [Gemmataceae bacterium]MCI0739360.1 hypothetical protein [Gemmataceae bacterium]
MSAKKDHSDKINHQAAQARYTVDQEPDTWGQFKLWEASWLAVHGGHYSPPTPADVPCRPKSAEFERLCAYARKKYGSEPPGTMARLQRIEDEYILKRKVTAAEMDATRLADVVACLSAKGADSAENSQDSRPEMSAATTHFLEMIEWHRRHFTTMNQGHPLDLNVVNTAILCWRTYQQTAAEVDRVVQGGYFGPDQLDKWDLVLAKSVRRGNETNCAKAVPILKMFARKHGINPDGLTMTEGAALVDEIVVALRTGMQATGAPSAEKSKMSPVNANSQKTAANNLGRFLDAMDRWHALWISWGGPTPRYIATSEAFPNDATEARTIIAELQSTGSAVTNIVAEHGGNSMLVEGWLDAQNKQHFDEWARKSWEQVRLEVKHAQSLELGAADAPENNAGAKANDVLMATRDKKGKLINERMAARLMENPECVWWTVEYWAKSLKCSKSTVNESPAWDKIMTMRKLREAEKATKHNNYKPIDRRRMGKKRSGRT